jgi:integrase
MGRQPEYTVGDYWLAKRPDGRSPFWQIRWYDERAKTTRSISTGCERLEAAKDAIHAFVMEERSKGPQEPDEALVLAILKRFYDERGPKVKNRVAFASSFRIFTGFLMQDKIGAGAVVADLKSDVWERFIDWRTGPHSYTAPFAGKTLSHESPGVSGEAIQRTLSDIRAALNYAVKRDRLPFAPHVPNVPTSLRSPPRDFTLSYEQLGAIIGYSLNDLEALRWILGMLATGARPDATLAWNIAEQYKRRDKRLLDTHPHGWPTTKKRNAIVPVIEPFHAWLGAWGDCPHKPAKSRKRWWRNMRKVLGLGEEIVPKVIRHTVATELRAMGVPQSDVEGLLGHQMSNRTTAVYAKYDPTRLILAKQGLERIWQRSWDEAFKWLSEHFRDTDQFGGIIIVDRNAPKCLDSRRLKGGAAWGTRTHDPIITNERLEGVS